MNTKVCSKCKVEKETIYFNKDKSKSSGLYNSCKECTRKNSKKHYQSNKDNIIEYQKKYYNENKNIVRQKQKNHYQNNKDYYKDYNKEYSKNNKEKVKENRKIWVENNKDKIKIYSKKGNKQYRENNKEKVKDYRKKYYNENKDYYKEYNKNYRESNKDKKKIYFKEYIKIYNKERKNNDPLFKLTSIIRTSIFKLMKKKAYTKKTKTYQILGCPYEEFKLHLESKFQPWMNWDNYGNPKDGILEPNKTWDIDHIIPMSTAKTEEDIIKLNHYTNLQPLCSYTNRYIKKDKINN